MNRIDRITAILIQLQSKKVVKAQDIADRFNISLRTVYRDVKTLEEAGIPVIGENGIGYSLMEGYRLPPVMFTREEATAFLTAEKFIDTFTDDSTRSIYESAMFKIKAVLRGNEKDMLESMSDHIEVRRNYAPFSQSSANNSLQAILQSIADKQAIHIRYEALHSGDASERIIEPVGVIHSRGYWHTIAWCRLRNDYRNFRADCIKQVRATGQDFGKQHPSLKKYLEQTARQEELTTIIVEVDSDKVRHLNEYKYFHGFVADKIVKNRTQMTFLCWSPEVFVRWYSMYADFADIIEPKSLKDIFRAYLSKLSEKAI